MSSESAEQVSIIGIDLGTTHTVVAHAPDATSAPQVVPLSQYVDQGRVGEEDLLPSFLYARAEHEQAAPVAPWDDAVWLAGRYAQRRAFEAPGRSIVSAKSWLCHERVDRTAAILPWVRDASAGSPKLSPVEASQRLLVHVRHALAAQGLDTASARVVLTVPASFDPVARSLTQEAARKAGIEARLLEEPQAAFYDFMARSGPQALADVLGAKDAARVLVVDVGGGTTDLALIAVRRAGDEVLIERVAVGRHLLLGGDNIDLALAHRVEGQLSLGKERLAPAEFAQLLQACRTAKEQLLGEGAPASVPLRIARRGSSLLGNVLKAELLRAEVEELVLEGFLPLECAKPGPQRSRAGLVGFGLPFERDPAITRHVFEFLARHAAEAPFPDAVLLNGGLFHAPACRERLARVLSEAAGREVQVLGPIAPDLAVARGAVAFGQATLGGRQRIASGASHGYYVALATSADATKVLCVVPRGAPESVPFAVAEHRLGLVVGAAVRFDLYASATAKHRAGELVTVDENFMRLAPVTATVPAASGAPGAAPVAVTLEGELSPWGTVQLACIEQTEPPRRHGLAFELRGADDRSDAAPASLAKHLAPVAGLPSGYAEAAELLTRLFGEARADVREREVKDLVRVLERLLGPRKDWNATLLRALFDVLAPLAAARRRSVEHERLFFWLLGFCLRPGFGHPGDPKRVARIAPLFRSGLAFAQDKREWEQFFIAWRRVAPGLGESLQLQIRDRLDPFLAPAERKLKKPKGFRPQAEEEMWVLGLWLERVTEERKQDLGDWALERTWTDRRPLWWELLGRIGAREPIYGSVHQVVSAGCVERWLSHLLSEDWTDSLALQRAAASLARATGDRLRDVGAAPRAAVVAKLERARAPAELIRCVREPVAVGMAERAVSYGDELPLGLVLVDDSTDL